MKRILLALTVFAFTSISMANSVVGKWDFELTDIEGVTGTTEYKADGTFTAEASTGTVIQGTYSFADGVLTSTDEDGNEEESEVTFASADEWSIVSDNYGKVNYKRQAE